jgi:hypothetical protein
LKFVGLMTGSELDTVGALLPSIFVNAKRVLTSARGCERASKHHCIFDGEACALAQKWRHRVCGIAEHRNALFAAV